MSDNPRPRLYDLEPLMTVEELAAIIGRSPLTVRQDASRRPQSLPPRMVIPGSRKLLWRRSTVTEWLDQLEKAEAERQAELARIKRPQTLAEYNLATFGPERVAWRKRR